MSIDDIRMTFTREALLERLISLRPLAEKQDAKRKAKHAKDEEAFQALFKRKLNEALTWDYARAKKSRFQPDFKSYEQPDCPASLLDMLERQIGLVERSTNKRFVINNGGTYSRIYQLLTLGVKEEKGLC